MSNTMNTPPTIRWQLLSTVSAFALLTSTYTAEAAGNDADRPLIWMELGGQLESVSGQGDVFAPNFLSIYSTSPVLQKVTPLQAQRPSRFGFGEQASISFQPENSDWVFSANLRYGRSSNSREVDHQTGHIYIGTMQKTGKAEFADTKASRDEKNNVLDFSVGKDLGLGMLGSTATTTLSLGVRFAQFTSRADVDIRARPDLHIKYFNYYSFHDRWPYFHTYHDTGHARRSFHGIGPSLTWNGTAPFAGNSQDGEITLDWGINAGILFGKQRAHVQHHETARYVSASALGKYHSAQVHQHSGGHDTDRSVSVPNVGGFAGVSYRYDDAKLSFGYRADFFFGAMDTGIDVAKKSNATFNGPYASISVGLGD